MTKSVDLCVTFAECVYDYQSLISGILALIAAIWSIYYLWKTANLPIRAQREHEKELDRRRLKFLCLTLAEELQLLATRARQAEGTIKVFAASNGTITEETRAKTKLMVPAILDEWEFMSLVSSDTFNELMTYRHELVNHNFDVQRAAGAFGADSFREIMQDRLKSIQMHSVDLSAKILRLGAYDVTFFKESN